MASEADGSRAPHGDACICPAHPLPASLSVRSARDAYLKENGFSVAAYEDPWTKVSFFGLPMAVPNTTKHRWAIRLHDLHHVATGFGTDMPGEVEISAWEARRGLRAIGLYVGAIVAGLTLFGLVIEPTRTKSAWRRSDDRRSLFHTQRVYEDLLEMTVGELRAVLGVPTDGLSEGTRKLHPDAPNPVSSTEVTPGDRAPEPTSPSA